MKMNKKKLFIIGGSALAVILAAVILIVSLGGNKMPIVEPEESKPTESSAVVIEEPEKSDETTSEDTSVKEIEDDGNALKPDENIAEDTANRNTGAKAEINNTPAAEAEPPKAAEPENTGGGIQIRGNPPVEETYNCGCANHHCQSAGYHASLLNRELEGCPYCGSHSCASFYAVNEWGFTKYNPTLCPQYNAKADPNEYCPDCGRKMWSKDNPTGCFRYLQDTQCECGEFVTGNTCHHH